MKKVVIFCLFFLIFTLMCAALTGPEWEALLSLDWDDEDPFEEAEIVEEEPLPEPVVEVVEAPPPPPPEPAPAPPPPPVQTYQPPPQPEPQVYQPPPPPEPYPYPPPQPAQVYQPPPPPEPAPAPAPQPPVRTVVPPSITFVFSQPPAAAPPPAAPPVEVRRPINVMPQMPHPYSATVYRVQLGAYSNTELARKCFDRLQSAGFTPFYEQYGSLYRVVLVGIRASDIPLVVQRLDAAGFTDAWIREER